tara:strand:+ start:268 stop:507 length:240 start_codon:yes stop_codon:yes gene_type:complete
MSVEVEQIKVSLNLEEIEMIISEVELRIWNVEHDIGYSETRKERADYNREKKQAIKLVKKFEKIKYKYFGYQPFDPKPK